MRLEDNNPTFVVRLYAYFVAIVGVPPQLEDGMLKDMGSMVLLQPIVGSPVRLDAPS